MSVKEGTVRADDGATIWYETHTPSSAVSAVPFVLIMGMSGIGRDFYPLVQALAKTRQVVILDNRGLGNSKFPEDWDGDLTLEQMGFDVIAVCKHLGLKEVDMLGWSMGGFILQLLLISPEASTTSGGERAVRGVTIRKAVLAATATKLPHGDFDAEALQAQGAAIKDKEQRLRTMTEEMIKLQYYPEWIEESQQHRDIIEKRVQNVLKIPRPQEIIGLQIAAIAATDTRKALPSIPESLPVLILHGSRDRMITFSETKYLEQGIKHAEWLHHPEIDQLYGHWFYDHGKDGAEGWARELTKWLDRDAKAKL